MLAMSLAMLPARSDGSGGARPTGKRPLPLLLPAEVAAEASTTRAGKAPASTAAGYEYGGPDASPSPRTPSPRSRLVSTGSCDHELPDPPAVPSAVDCGAVRARRALSFSALDAGGDGGGDTEDGGGDAENAAAAAAARAAVLVRHLGPAGAAAGAGANNADCGEEDRDSTGAEEITINVADPGRFLRQLESEALESEAQLLLESAPPTTASPRRAVAPMATAERGPRRPPPRCPLAAAGGAAAVHRKDGWSGWSGWLRFRLGRVPRETSRVNTRQYLPGKDAVRLATPFRLEVGCNPHQFQPHSLSANVSLN